jgi:hypothetical protein
MQQKSTVKINLIEKARPLVTDRLCSEKEI